jgi:hypothetical protein
MYPRIRINSNSSQPFLVSSNRLASVFLKALFASKPDFLLDCSYTRLQRDQTLLKTVETHLFVLDYYAVHDGISR